MAAPKFRACVEAAGDIACVRVAGEIDMSTASELRAGISRGMARRRLRELVIDLAEVTFCDTSGLQALVNARRSCIDRDIQLVLRHPGRMMRDVLCISGLADYFTIEP